MHRKMDSDSTSLAGSSPPRSPRRTVYYVMSPSNGDTEKQSIVTPSPGASPVHHHYHNLRFAVSPIHHSRESSTSRFSPSLKNGNWRKLHQGAIGEGKGGAEEEEEEEELRLGFRCYAVMFGVGFLLLFGVFSVVLWGASRAYEPMITVQSVVFERYNIQAGTDFAGVPTKMISINSTVKMRFRNPATFFGVHVSSTPLLLFYDDLTIASGHMMEFFARRKNERLVSTVVLGKEVPVYGGGADLMSHKNGGPPAVVPFTLSFVVRSRANILGLLVRSKFDRAVRCSVYLRESHLGRPVDLHRACEYD